MANNSADSAKESVPWENHAFPLFSTVVFPMSTTSAPSRSEFATTLQIIPVVFFTFLCYLTIGIPLAVLPGYVHGDLGYSAVLAGAAISVQYLATLASRPLAGRCADTLGPKRTVSIGLLGCGASGVLLLLAVLCGRWPVLSLALLVCSRLVLGFGESLCGTGAILWGIGRVGTSNNAPRNESGTGVPKLSKDKLWAKEKPRNRLKETGLHKQRGQYT